MPNPLSRRPAGPRVRAVIVVALVWLTAGVVVAAARWTKPTPQTVLSQLRASEGRNRPGFVAELAGKMNRLTFAERQQVKVSADYLRAYAALTPGEKERYLTATVETDLRQTLDAIEKMPRDQRRALLNQVAGETESNNLNLDEDPPTKERVRRLAEGTLKDYFEALAPDAREELGLEVDLLWKYLRIW